MDGQENATINNATDVTPENTQPAQPETPSTPSVEELLARVAEAEARAAKSDAEKDRFKNSVDKLTKELADKKRADLANMTADEQQKAQIEEEIKVLRERAEAAEAENERNKAFAAYKAIADEKTVENLIEAVSAKDHASIAAIMATEVQRAVKAAQAEWMKSRPPVNTGDPYTSMTKEQILAIQDMNERQRAIAMNLELFQ